MHISTITLFTVVAAMSVMTAVEAVPAAETAAETETRQVRRLSRKDFSPTLEEREMNKRVVALEEVPKDLHLFPDALQIEI
jgi:hypothetical protein